MIELKDVTDWKQLINNVVCCDNRDMLAIIPDKSINLIIADIPYYKIKADKWDNQWKTFEDYLQWVEDLFLMCKPKLKDNGSLYVFGDDERIAYIQVRLDKHFVFLNNLVWYKRNNMPIKHAHNFRTFCPVTERILFYGLQCDRTGLETVILDINNFQTLRKYAKEFQEDLGLTLKTINKKLGHRKAEHFFYWNSTQWNLPTKETYAELCQLPQKSNFLRREYEDLRREYEDLRREYEDLRRTFNYQNKVYDVIDIPIISQSENTDHSTTKPEQLIELLIRASSNEGDMVLDPCMGSWTTAKCAESLNRKWIGCDISREYCEIGEKRINQFRQQVRLF